MKEKIKQLSQKKETYYILSSLVVCILLLVLVILPSTRANETGVFPNQTIDNLSFQDGRLKIEDGISNYSVKVFNTKTTTKNLSTIELHFKNNEGKEIALLYGYIGDSISGKETKTLTASIDKDINEATMIEYIIK